MNWKSIGSVCLLAASIAMGRDSLPNIRFGGFVSWDNFRLWQVDYKGNEFEGDWFSAILAGISAEFGIDERLTTRIALEAKTYRPFPEEQDKQESRFGKFDVYLQEAKGRWRLGNPEDPHLEIEAGLFFYDYNPNQRNLGEYLLRSQIYPCNMFTDFDQPMEKVLGLRISNQPFAGFHHDVLLMNEYKYYPKADFSLAYLFDWNLGGVLGTGGGVDFHHLIPVKPDLVTPRTDENTYLRIPAQTWYDSAGTPHVIESPMEGFLNTLREDDSLSYLQMGTYSREIHPQIQTSGTFFSYRGIKLMAMLSFDPKPLFGSPRCFGREDLKIYAEAAVLGVKDYPFYYNNILERIPITVGLNIPFFKLLDICAVEVEYYGYRLPNDWQSSLRNGLPHPGSMNFSPSAWNPEDYRLDNWKWSVYTRRTIGRRLSVVVQAACDHLRLPDQFDNTFESLMKKSTNLWGVVRLTARY